MRPHELDASAASSVVGLWLRAGTFDPTPSGLLLAWLCTCSFGWHLTLVERADPTAGPWLGAPLRRMASRVKFPASFVTHHRSCHLRQALDRRPCTGTHTNCMDSVHRRRNQSTTEVAGATNKQPSSKPARGGRPILGEWTLTFGRRVRGPPALRQRARSGAARTPVRGSAFVALGDVDLDDILCLKGGAHGGARDNCVGYRGRQLRLRSATAATTSSVGSGCTSTPTARCRCSTGPGAWRGTTPPARRPSRCRWRRADGCPTTGRILPVVTDRPFHTRVARHVGGPGTGSPKPDGSRASKTGQFYLLPTQARRAFWPKH